ncbi:MAG TPA: extracellular solute-binding protein [Polyangiaceae bacterium]|nr:extracellular solute-binding protein [Polyangiaceae bacterium]
MALGVGCSDSSDAVGPGSAGTGGGGAQQQETRTLKVASSWFSPSEQEALQVTLAAFQAQTGAKVEVVKLEQGQTERTAQYQASDWDVGQENFYNLANSFADGNGGYTALDLSTESELTEGLAKVFPNVRTALTVDGQLIGFPMNLHRENTLHYVKSLMAEPPTTLEGMKQACDEYVQGGSTGPKPLAVAKADWVYRILFESMLPAPVVSGIATTTVAHTDFASAGDVIAYYQEHGCLYVAEDEQSWSEAAQGLYDGKAKMFIHGDWAKGYLVQVGWKAGTDFDVVPAPGSEGAFYYGIDTFAVNKNSANKDLAVQFAKIALSNAVQAGFSEKKGSTPGIVFEDPEHAFSDPSLRATYAQLSAGFAAGTAVPVPPWMGNQGGPLMVGLRDGEKTADQTATDFMTVYPQSN